MNTHHPEHYLNRSIELLGGLTPFATALGVKNPQVVVNWRKRGVPATWCRKIEAVTNGAVTCEQLCPEVFGKAA